MSLRLAVAVVLVAGAGLAALTIADRPGDRRHPAALQAEPAPGLAPRPAPGLALASSSPREIAKKPAEPAPSPVLTPKLAPTGIVPSIALEAFLAHDYPAFWQHKAIAVGPDGVFAAAFREPDPQTAIDVAQSKCKEKLRWHADPVHRRASCRPVAVNEVIALRADQQTAAQPQASKPIGNVVLTRTTDAPPAEPSAVPSAKWTLLRISACGANADRPWHKSWRDFFAAHRVPEAHLELTAPPGAARPCPRDGAAYDRFLRWNRARLKSALARVRAASPKSAREVLIWADAGAADVVHATPITSPVRVITTNAPCTLSLSRHSLLPPAIKVAAFVARADADLERAARRRAQPGIQRACAEAAKQRPGLQVIALPGKPRFPLWSAEVMAKLAALTALPPIHLTSDPSERLDFLPFEAHRFFTKAFSLHASNRAMVISRHGRMFVAAGHRSSSDAVQEALYQCRNVAGENGFIASQSAPCILFAINDKVVFRET